MKKDTFVRSLIIILLLLTPGLLIQPIAAGSVSVDISPASGNAPLNVTYTADATWGYARWPPFYCWTVTYTRKVDHINLEWYNFSEETTTPHLSKEISNLNSGSWIFNTLVWRCYTHNWCDDVAFADTFIEVTGIPPEVAGMMPSDGFAESGEQTYTVEGSGFQSGATVFLEKPDAAPIPGTDVEFISESVLFVNFSFTTDNVGLYDVVVRNPDGSVGRLNEGFRVRPVPVLLIWGWGGNEANWEVIKPELERNGYTVEILPYDSSQRADYCAQNNVAPKVNEMLKTYNTSKIDIIAHSYGGLVARSYIEKFGGDKNVDHLVMLFTPNKGTLMADYITGEKTGYYSDNLDLLLKLFSGLHPRKDWESNFDLRASSNNEFLVQLNNNFDIKNKKYYVIAGVAPYPDTSILGINLGKPTSNEKVSPGRDDGFITMSSVKGLPGVPSYCVELDHSDINPFLEPKYDGPTLSTRLNTIRSIVGNVIIPALNDNPLIVDNCPTTPDPNDDKGLIGLVSHSYFRIKPGQSVNGNIRNNGGRFELGFSWSFSGPETQSYSQTLDSSPIPNFTFSLLSPSGKVITPSSPDTDPNIQFTRSEDYWRYSVNNSETGNWKYFITPTELPGSDINITAMAIGDVEIVPEPPVVVFPGFTSPPTDPDNDGIYEDLNGNTRLDFADVVLYFNQMEWIALNEPVSAFDLNGNGRIDFADIVKLFGEI